MNSFSLCIYDCLNWKFVIWLISAFAGLRTLNERLKLAPFKTLANVRFWGNSGRKVYSAKSGNIGNKGNNIREFVTVVTFVTGVSRGLMVLFWQSIAPPS